MKFLIAIPLVFSIAAFILSLLSLLAGYKKGFMDDYNLITFNTSSLGSSAVSSIISSGSIDGVTIPSSVATALEGALSGEIADTLATELGIGEFYTVHAMDFCQGDYSPNATVPSASHNVTNCTTPMDFSAYNFTSKLNEELSLGPFAFTLSELGVSDSVQEKLALVPKVAKALAAVFIASVGLTGLAMITSLAGFLLIPRAGRLLSFLNVCIAFWAMILLLASSLVATIAPRIVAEEIANNGGDDIGLEVDYNMKLASLTWAAFALMVLSLAYWFVEFIVENKQAKDEIEN
ncbi:hypothetical protein M406DRAFT_339597 [Cryphonectria parasitica EP155]|uniref:SUR7 protein n=1 Tax=Cryphonectria parasitica (strain ATCC 38755 / EP155) TaxID=660469 RepID=A0A9P5CQL8_CRYP1|nr:uncharacterized protein M406DRAFT_339597 [Cryphonectria parasitica EP155]KAF3766356.1 hypothetical protein M406DRAFT_339597 [Cryphonectria parasitica EP155]